MSFGLPKYIDKVVAEAVAAALAPVLERLAALESARPARKK